MLESEYSHKNKCEVWLRLHGCDGSVLEEWLSLQQSLPWMGLTSAFFLCFLTCLSCVSIVILKNTHEQHTHTHTLFVSEWESGCLKGKCVYICVHLVRAKRAACGGVLFIPSTVFWELDTGHQVWWQVPVPSSQLIGSLHVPFVVFYCGDHTHLPCIICLSGLIISLCLIIPNLPFVPFSCPLDLAVFNT